VGLDDAPRVGWEGWLHLFHVPDQGLGERAFQRTTKSFPRALGAHHDLARNDDIAIFRARYKRPGM
jgi:hypothetical protein